MRTKWMLAVVALFAMAVPSYAQSKTEGIQPMWNSGNDVLHWCDEDDPFPVVNVLQLRIEECDAWIMGIVQGIGMSEYTRPEPVTTKAQSDYDKSVTDYLKKNGIEPSITTPSGNACFPEVSADQFRRVVVKWLKDNPTKLDQHGGLLVYAALKNSYPCAKGNKQ